MTFLSDLARLIEAATKGPWFKRYCDDDNHMCMTVISGTDYGEVNTGQFRDEPDTIAATFHQIAPVVGDTADCNEATTDLILHLVNHAEAIEELVRAAESALNHAEFLEEANKETDAHTRASILSGMVGMIMDNLKPALEKLNRSE